MSEEVEVDPILAKALKKIDENLKRQAELEKKNEELEKRITEYAHSLDELLSPQEDEKPAEPAPEDPVHEWAKKQMVEREEKKKKTREKFRVKPKAEVEADADKLFQGMLLDGQE